ncbi:MULTISPECIES: tetratricopeptide repeat-containing sensor histidine kinase [Flavobacteriaceae]|uniref:histidine kinase n=2 Tax=Flavobacteriaceae TaxID=49546 RepID=A0A4Y8AYX3_9FLAO|nr:MULTISPECIES: hypothetical protein [Flavobacteriaceae]TEW77038.1 hypothetical protein E2488_04100 [Gramella jeungdoensis]
MKNLKFTFLFFVVFSCFLIASCTSKEEVKSSNTTALDSISLFMKDMKNNDLDFNTRLNRANRALQKIENKRSDTRIEQILAYKIYLFGNLKQLDSAVSINKALIQINIEKNDSVAIANNYYQLAYYYFQNDKKDSAFIANKLSKEIYIKLGDSSKIGENLAQMAIIQSGLGDFIGSDNNAIQALKYLDKDNLVYISAIYNSIAISAKKRKDYKEAIYWYNKAIETSTINSFKAVKSGNLAVVYRYLQEYDKSIAIFEELIKGGSLDNDIKAKSRVLDNLAYTKWLANENENVSDDLLAVLNTRREENDLWGLNASYAHLADYYKNKNPDIALKYARKMYKQAKLLNSAEDQLEAMQKLIELETSVKAKEYYHTYIKLSDSLMDAERNKLNKFEKLKYDSEKNREDNLQLKITNSKKELQLEKEKTRNIIGAASSGTVVLGLLGFLYYRKQKHRQEKRAEVYKTETRIAKKLHDEVANNMVNIMNKVQYTEDPKEQLLDDLEKVYLLTRDISHQNNSIETGVHFKKSLKNLLTSFNTTTTTIILKNSSEVTLEEIAKDKQIEIYRIMQELMVNMQKHSKATLVAISFKRTADEYFINYSDNGKGADQSELKVRNGLKNVETRIKSINGLITFETSLNKGFKAFISFKK